MQAADYPYFLHLLPLLRLPYLFILLLFLPLLCVILSDSFLSCNYSQASFLPQLLHLLLHLLDYLPEIVEH